MDATMTWFHWYMKNGLYVQFENPQATRKLYPRLLRIDGDQPELVTLVGKTCYLCWSRADAFGDNSVECSTKPGEVERMEDYFRADPLTATTLNALRNDLLHHRQPAPVDEPGCRPHSLNF